MGLKATDVLLKLIALGMPGVNINATLDAGTAEIIAAELGWTVKDISISEKMAVEQARSAAPVEAAEMLPRPPIITVMGHVDHGKTSLLDRIRSASVAAGEAGGITQHIGAYRARTSRGTITFLDTPGHEAFTQMRARGAQVTDIVVLVVAADDGVMQQTREAIAHAKSAKVPVVVAINKMDKPGADPDRVRRDLAELGLVPEAWAGDTIFCEVSAKTGQGVDQLLEMLALQAEVLELRANPKRPAVGTVIEALLDRGRGPVARVLITDGTLRAGDPILAGSAWGKVRAMADERGHSIAVAGPGAPVELFGLSDVPHAGELLHAVDDARQAQQIAESRKAKMARNGPLGARLSLEDLTARIAESGRHELRLLVKADVRGSIEALTGALAKLSTEKVKIAIVHAGVGGISEGDVNLAIASKAIVVGFNTRPTANAVALAEAGGVQIRRYDVIYDLVDDMKKAMAGLLEPQLVEKALGKAEVRQVFRISHVGRIAGCMVTEGLVKRSAKARLVRDSAQVWDGKIASLRRFKEDVGQADRGMECGVLLEGYSDVKPGDVIECYMIEQVAATL
jgi:translation initiation factor IF-2